MPEWISLEFLIQVLLAMLLGGLLGMERERIHKPAGLRTYIMVCLGAMLFTVLSVQVAIDFANDTLSVDPTRIAAQVLTGIGFIGAGVIMKRDEHIEGVTTAAGLWLCAAVGMAVGFSYYFMAVVTTIAGIVAFLLIKAEKKKRGPFAK